MNGDDALTMTDVSISFSLGRRMRNDRFVALRSVSINLRHREKLGIVGRNGAGKSTLLRIIADVLKPDSGEVVRNHGRCQLLTLGLGFVPHLSGRENAILGGLLQGLSRREIEAKLEDIAEFSELGDFFDQPFSTYSSGMRARLGFSVALQLQPDILLIDEVLAVGDAAFKQKSKAALADRLNSDATVVLVSHDERLIAELCDRVVWLEQGQVVEQGPTAEVMQRYAELK